MRVIWENIFMIALMMTTTAVQASGVVECVEDGIPHRFHVGILYPSDEKWSRLMEESADLGVRMLELKPDVSLEVYMGALAESTRQGLRIQTRSAELADLSARAEHAQYFGKTRQFQTFLSLVSEGKYQQFLGIASEFLKENGVKVQGPSKSKAGELLAYQFEYETPNGKIPLGRLVAMMNRPKILGQSVDFYPTKPNEVPAVIQAAGAVFEKLKTLKSAPKNEDTLKQVKSYVAEMYWLISHAWPYERGSASVADLAARSMMDWLGIANAPWKQDISPNMSALLNRLEDYKELYETQLTAPLRWKP